MRAAAMAAVCAAALLTAGAAPAQRLPWQTSSVQAAGDGQLVHFLYPQEVTLQAGKPQTVQMHFRINSGLHINSHTPLQKSLIRTQLAVVEPPGLNVAAVDFPPGSSFAFPLDPAEKLSVYTGEFVLTMHLTAQPGNHLLQGGLRYQACDTNTCFPPRTVPVAIEVIAH